MRLFLRLFIITVLMTTFLELFADSGGPLSPEQAAYDVKYYDLDLNIDPVTKTIDGSLICCVEILNAIDELVLDLDDPFTVDSVLLKINNGDFTQVSFTHENGIVNTNIPNTVDVGDNVSVHVFYNGAPRIASNPPWGVGFVWETTSNGDPWIGVACEDDGADIWWPCKDHPSDEPDSMYIRLTVPDPLSCISNGRFIESTANDDNTTTFDWFVSTPINNYNVTFYAAEYSLIEDDYVSISGETIPFKFWVLPEDYQAAVDFMDVFLTEFNFLESICGPFPFGTDKHGFAHAPYWGMEHQTIIAYDNDFNLNSWGFDYIHYHELAHEWWGNLITAKNWADVWIHEGIATYTEALYVEHMHGMESYHQYMNNHRPWDNHSNPLAPYDELTASQGFDLNPYNRGASVMHTLRYHLGDEDLFNLMERWAYPDPNDFDNTNGRLCRLLSTEDMMLQAEEVTGRDLDPFFDVFFREAAYPVLNVHREHNKTTFSWQTENNVPLDVNVPVMVNGIEQTVEMTAGQGELNISLDTDLEIDPKQWILMGEPSITTSVSVVESESFRLSNHPNPFEYSTTIEFSFTEVQKATLKVYDVMGNEIKTLAQGIFLPGDYEFHFEAKELPGGTYFYQLNTDNQSVYGKMILLE